MTEPYVLTRGAAADLRDISGYTLNSGELRSGAPISTGLNRLPQKLPLVRTRIDLRPGMRVR